MSDLVIPSGMLDWLRDKMVLPDSVRMLTLLTEYAQPGTGHTGMWLLMSRCFIPVINRNTIPHLRWRNGMLAMNDFLVHDLPRPEAVFCTSYFENFIGVQAIGVPFKTHAEFIRTALSPHLHNLSSGQATSVD